MNLWIAVKVTPITSKIVQQFLFDRGYDWFTGKQQFKYLDSKYLYVYTPETSGGNKDISYSNALIGCANLVSLEQFFNLLDKPEPIKVQLSENGYTAVINPYYTVNLGSLEFDFSAIKKLASEVERMESML